MISDPISLSDWFEMAALATESSEMGGLGISLIEFCEMSPWNFEFMVEFKGRHRDKVKKARESK